MAYQPNAANSTPTALKAAQLYNMVHGVALANAIGQATAPIGPLNLYPVSQEVSFAPDSYQDLSPADKAHNKAVEAFLASYAQAGA